MWPLGCSPQLCEAMKIDVGTGCCEWVKVLEIQSPFWRSVSQVQVVLSLSLSRGRRGAHQGVYSDDMWWMTQHR